MKILIVEEDVRSERREHVRLPDATEEDFHTLCSSPDPGCDCGFCAKAEWRDE